MAPAEKTTEQPEGQPREDPRIRRLPGLPGEGIQVLFEPEAALGAGAFGSVRLAKERSTGEQVALKIIRRNEDYLGLFEHLGRSLMEKMIEFRHPNVVHYHCLAEDIEFVYVVMERYTGPDLFDHFMEHAPLPIRESLHIMDQVMSALVYLHNAVGVVHCDIKPENYMFATPERTTLKLIDFGSACVVAENKHAAGTIGFCAPEVFSRGCSPASDVFSAGIILFNSLTGDWPKPMRRELWQEAGDDGAFDAYIRALGKMAPDAIACWLEGERYTVEQAPLCKVVGSMLHGCAEARPTAVQAQDQIRSALESRLGGSEAILMFPGNDDVYDSSSRTPTATRKPSRKRTSRSAFRHVSTEFSLRVKQNSEKSEKYTQGMTVLGTLTSLYSRFRAALFRNMRHCFNV